MFGAFEMAESAGDPAERARWLTFALVGAGPTGVELAGQIRELATKTLRREYRHIQPEDALVMLFDGGNAPLAMFGEKLSGLAARQLGKLGVELHMGSLVTHVDLGGLEVKNHDGNGDQAPVRHRLVDRGRRGTAAGRGGGQGHRRAAGPGGPPAVRPGPVPARPSRHPGGRGHDEPGQAARGRRGRHADRPVRGSQDQPRSPGPDLRQAVPLPRPRLGRLHLPRPRRRLGVQPALRRFPGLGGLAFHPHRLPHRLPQPHRSAVQLVVRVHPGPASGTQLHHR